MTNSNSDRQMRELVRTSERIAAVPGLLEQVTMWQAEMPSVRRELDRDAGKLAAPRLWPDTVVSLAKTGRRLLGAAAPDAPLALLTAAAAGAGLPIAPPSSSGGTIERAQRLVRAGGPAYIKLGQFIASSHGLLPDAWVEAFALCRNDAPRLEPGIAESVVARELGLTALQDFDPEPIAAGSIGQVHTARLPDGLKVVVKIRRPGLRARFRRDIETLALVAAAADRLVPGVRVANLRGFVQLFAQLALHELDFRLEAVNAAESAAILDDAGIDAVTVPLPRPGMVTQRVLVMPFVEGVRYDQALDRFGADLDGVQLLHTAIHSVLLSTLYYGLSHGDLHAGNVLIPQPDRFNLLDYGICARLTHGQRSSLARFLVAFADSNAAGQVAALTEFGAFADDVQLHQLRDALQTEADALNRRDGGAVTFDRLGATLSQLLRVFAANGFAMPKELVLFFKNLMYLASFAASVAPDLDIFDAVTTVIYEIAEAHPELFGPQAAPTPA